MAISPSCGICKWMGLFMLKIKHKSATSAHYDHESKSYDLFNRENTVVINKTVENILKANRVKSVVDLTCGTGSQVFWLAQRGFDIRGFDINRKMIAIAISKARESKLKLKFHVGDMRTTQAGQFDAVLTIFNAIGHLTKNDFDVSIKNIRKNLVSSGIYIFDIFNHDYLSYKDNITKLTIDWLKTEKSISYREIQYSTIDSDGILTSYDHYQEIKENGSLTEKHAVQTLKVYSAFEIKELFRKNGFSVIKQCAVDGSRFNRMKTERILTVAKKV